MDQKQQNAERLTDKAFTRLLLTSVLGILACLACLCSATWALFSVDISNSQNQLVSGVYDLSVTVVEAASGDPVAVKKGENGISSCTLGAPGRYVVTLSVSDAATVKKGHCLIKAGSKTQKTAAICAGAEGSISFAIETQTDALTVYFAPTWGIPSAFDVDDGGSLTF